MKILQINTHDIYGGAAKIAFDLLKGYQAAGHDSWMLVGEKLSREAKILKFPSLPQENKPINRIIWGLREFLYPLQGRVRGVFRLRRILFDLAGPQSASKRRLGYEDFDFPGTWKIPEYLPFTPDLVQAHNLHGGYFDLRYLPIFSKMFPLVINLHDSWLFSGHCSCSLGCDRWKTGCGHCPDLTIYPSIPHDLTAENWQRKQDIYRQSRLYVTTPSKWQMDKLDASMLSDAVQIRKVINNGVDLTVFKPADKEMARMKLGIAPNRKVLAFVSSDFSKSPFKDFRTIKAAILDVSLKWPVGEILFLALGDKKGEETLGNAQIRYMQFEKDPTNVANVYQAADIYLHAAKEDNFPNTVIEAMACGLPVIATQVGGIPEQVVEGKTGWLVPEGSHEMMAKKTDELLRDDSSRIEMGRRGAMRTVQFFDMKKQVKVYLDWFNEVIEDWSTAKEDTVVS